MNENGDGCYPSTKRQSEETGLSERSVCTHLELAEKAGFIKRCAHGFSGQAWKRNQYVASYPEGTELGSVAIIDDGGTEDSSVSLKGTEPLSEGTEPNDKKALNHVQSNTTDKHSSKTTPEKRKPKFILPDWIPREDWDDFMELRKKKGKPLTERAKDLTIRKLADFNARGSPPDQVLQQSILNGWTGIFELTEQKNDQHSLNKPTKFSQFAVGIAMATEARRAETCNST